MLLLGLGHKAQHGKDTFADAVLEANPKLRIKLCSFADPLRAEIHELMQQRWDHFYPNKPIEPQRAMEMLCHFFGVPFDPNAPVDKDNPYGKQRKLQQFYGTEFRRAQDPEYWTKKAKEMVHTAQAEGYDACILRDVRFKNEYDLIQDLGGVRIKVSRLGFESGVPNHISEVLLENEPFDHHIAVQDGDLELLKKLAVVTFSYLYGKHTGV